MVINTKHFTEFVSYTPSSGSSSGGTVSDDNGGGGGSTPAPITGTGLVGGLAGVDTVQPLETQTSEDSQGEQLEESSNQITGAAVGTTNKTSIILISVVVGLVALGLAFQIFSKRIRFGKKGIF